MWTTTMPRVRWLISVLAVILAVGVLVGCEGGEAQPAGDQSVSSRVVVAEVFTSADCPHCPPAKEALEVLASDYGEGKLLVLEYALTGHLSCDDAQCRAGECEVRSVPTVFFNVQNRTEGARSYDEYKEIVESELSQDAAVALSAMSSISSDVANIDATVTNRGDGVIEDARVMFVVYEDMGDSGHHYVVRDIVASPLDALFVGESRDFNAVSDALFWCDMSNAEVAVFVQSITGAVLQATLAKPIQAELE